MKRALCTLMICILFTGCAHKQTTGDQMLSQSTEAGNLGNQWKKGQSLIEKGTALREKGHEKIRKGNEMVTKGDHLIAKGKSITRETEDTYRQEFPTPVEKD